MKIKMLSLFAIVLFMGSSFSSTSMNISASVGDCSFNYDHCIYTAGVKTFVASHWGFTPAEAYEMGNNAYDSCVDNVDIEAAACLANQE